MASGDLFDAVKQTGKLVQYIEETEGVVLKNAGPNLLQGCCPFHDDHNPSLYVHVDKQTFTCYGSGCAKGGTIIDWCVFHFEKKGQTILPTDAVRYLCDRFSLPRPAWTQAQRDQYNKEREAERLLGEIGIRLMAEYDGSAGQAYLRGRGITDDVAANWHVGYAANWSVIDAIVKRYKRDVVQQAGLLTKKGEYATWMFDKRVMVPCMIHGRIVQIYGRSILADSDIPHGYLSCPRAPWGIDYRGGPTVLCEATIDAMSLCVAGYKGVAVGGATSEKFLDDIKNVANNNRLILGFDGDADANKGPLMALKTAAMLARKGCFANIVDWSGSGKDVNDILRQDGPEAIKAIVEQAVSPSEFRRIKGLEGSFTDPLLIKDGNKLLMEGHGLLYTVKSIDNKKDAKGIHATVATSSVVTGESLGGSNEVNLPSAIARKRIAKLIETRAKSRGHVVSLVDVEIDLELLQEELERWQQDVAAKEGLEDFVTAVPELTPAELEEATALISQKNVMEAVTERVQEWSIIGEELAIKTEFLTLVSRIIPKPLAVCVKGESSTGKSYVLEAVAKLCPPEDLRNFTRMTKQALFNAPPDFLKHKFLIISERPGAEEADFSLRTIISQGDLTSFTVEDVDGANQSVVKYVEGPVAYAETTTALDLNAENVTRLLEIYPDASPEQTERILARQRWEETEEGLFASYNTEHEQTAWQNAVRLLKPIKVIIPHATRLRFPNDKPRARRDQRKFHLIIKLIALVHQFTREHFQREMTDGTIVEYIKSTPEDYEEALWMAKGLLSPSMDDMDPRSRVVLHHVLEIAKSKLRQKQQAETVSMDEKLTENELLMQQPVTKREILAIANRAEADVQNALIALVTKFEMLNELPARGRRPKQYFLATIPDSSGSLADRLAGILVTADEYRSWFDEGDTPELSETDPWDEDDDEDGDADGGTATAGQ